MDNIGILKYVNEFFKAFEKSHTFYIHGEQIKFCKATGLYVIWDLGNEWGCLTREEINAVTIEGLRLTITVTGGKEYTFIAKPKTKEEVTERIISRIKGKLIRLPYKKEISEILHLLNELKRITKEQAEDTTVEEYNIIM